MATVPSGTMEAQYKPADPVRNPFTWEGIDFPWGEWVPIPESIVERAQSVPWLKVRKRASGTDNG